MDLLIGVPRQPVDLTPGAQTRVPVELSNTAGAAVEVRLSVAPSRAGEWARPEPATLAVPAGGRAEAELVFQPPADTPPSTALLPYTVQADDVAGAEPPARATGLAGLAAPERLRAVLHRTAGGRLLRFTLSLENRTGDRLGVTVRPRLYPPGGRVTAEPETVDLPAGGTAAVRVQARPKAPLAGRPVPYALTLTCTEPDDAPLAVVRDAGPAPPVLGKAAVVLIIALLLAAGAAVVFAGRSGLPTGRAGAPDDARVRAPYALVAAFPQRDGAGRAEAEAALARLTAAGLPVRLVDSTRSPDLADGLFVVLSDGFGSADEARAFCERFRAQAPRCDVVP